MSSVREADFWEAKDARIRCGLCPHRCRIAEGRRGACGVRLHLGGRLYTLAYDRIVARNVEPIEKKPLFHFLPGSRAYSIATVGCNLRCAYCQNWQISQWGHEYVPRLIGEIKCVDGKPIDAQLEQLGRAVPGDVATPEEIVRAALASGAAAIAYTYTEPTAFFELAFETAVLAHERGLRNVFVTNGFISEAALRTIAPVLDAANVDLKSFREKTYRKVCRARLAPVLEAIRLYRELGIWIEITTLVIPELNDGAAELHNIAEFVAMLGPEVPWHLSRFYPAWRMLDRPLTPQATLERARRIGEAAGLRYVYQGNVPGTGGEDTLCPGCGAPVIERCGFTVFANRLHEGRCPECGTSIDGVGMSRAPTPPGARSFPTSSTDRPSPPAA